MEHDAADAVAGPVPEGIGLDDIVDIEAIRRIVEDFHALTGHVVSIADLDDRFLVRVGWFDACTRFHRANTESCELCRESDLDMTEGVARGETRAYHCKNGFWHVVSPLFVADRHMGNIFTSQFFYDDEDVDLASFEARAERFGYDRDEYLAAVRAIPRYSHETIDVLMRFLVGLAEQIAALGLSRLQIAETMAARERALEAGAESENRFSALIERAPIPIAVSGTTGDINYLNNEFVRLFGYTLREIPTIRDWFERAYPDEAYRAEAVALWNAEVETAEREGRAIVPHDYSITRKDGGVRVVAISGAVVGERMLVLMDDVTERRRVEDALRLSEAKFAAAYRTSPDAVNINRLSDGLYLEINEGFTHLTGYTAEDVARKTSSEIQIWVDPADRDRLVAGLTATGLVKNLEAEFRRKDGSSTTALMSARVIEVDGEPCILSVTRDISDRKRAERLLAESQRIARVGHYEWDIVADHWDASEVLMDIFGIDESYPRDLAGFLGIVHPDDRAGIQRYVTEDVIGRDLPFNKEYRIVRVGDRAERWVHGLGSVTRDEAGTPLSLFGIIQDVTERRQAEADLEESAARLERMVYDVAETMGRIVEARDPYTQGHQQRVASLGKKIALKMGLPQGAADEVEMAGLLHDVGKLRVPTEILTKPGHLSPIEFALVKDHPAQGHEILKAIAFPWAVADIALQHHERMDGSGYPLGLVGDQILLAARILAVADVVEAMASHRPYRPALGEDAAIEEIVSHPEYYDADVVAACVALHAAGGLGL
jgi:PAS domain S-box-containing protein/putative nucleotidyltransferase with HDIG domain